MNYETLVIIARINKILFDISARRKNKWTATQKVYVQMKNGLSAVGIRVDYDAIAVVRDALFPRDLGGCQ